uniref:Caspase-8 n=1 Tax=Neogobius melanostomus TaxID=47308 RepID=A0A8C6SNQ9_9GOBI
CADKLMYFVENVSEDVLDQLLDRLLWKKLLNSGEVESAAKQKHRLEKARYVVDTVIRKGDEVRLILHLQMKDSTLYKHLCQTCDCVIILCCSCTGDSWSIHIYRCKFKEYFLNYLIYPVTSKSIKNRVALLITNNTFTELKNRPGAEKDEENMKELLSTLGYEVVKHTNLTAKKMENALDDFSKHPKLKETDSVFVVISSHGKLGAVLGVNHKPDEPDELKVDDIHDKLNVKSCPALVNKPKIIIIQACRGINIFGVILISEETGSALVEADDVAVREIDEDVLRYTHKEKDFIALLSSTPRQSSSQHINYELKYTNNL